MGLELVGDRKSENLWVRILRKEEGGVCVIE
jgi:hypothetical protein